MASDAYGIGFVEETRTTRDQYCGCIATFLLDLHGILFSFVKNILLGRAEKL
jgi:hypothetical protein